MGWLLRNPWLDDIVWMKGNMPNGNQTTTVAGYPTSMYRRYNQRVPVSHGRTVQHMDTVGWIEGYDEVDKKLADLSGNADAYRMRQARMRHNSMINQWGSTLFHGSEADDPASFNGLGPRFADKSAANKRNILDAGGSGSDNTSIWLVVWSDNDLRRNYASQFACGLGDERQRSGNAR